MRPWIKLLTEREVQVLALIMSGISNKEIGQELGVTIFCIKYHVASILKKSGYRTKILLIAKEKL